MRILNFLIIFSFISQTSFASETTKGWWIGTFSKKKINTHLSGWMETQVRNNFDSGEVNQILYRTGLLYKVSNESLHEWGALLAYIDTNRSIERRLTFQHAYSYLNKKNQALSHRVRFEGRDFENTSNDSLRLRYLIRYVNKLKPFPLVLWNESFINLSNESDRGQDAYERNRLFLGTSFKFGETKIEFGYLNQLAFRDVEDLMEHLLVFYWFF